MSRFLRKKDILKIEERKLAMYIIEHKLYRFVNNKFVTSLLTKYCNTKHNNKCRSKAPLTRGGEKKHEY